MRRFQTATFSVRVESWLEPFSLEMGSKRSTRRQLATMNVATSRDVWCYYYTQFSIVQIQDDRVVHHWTCPVSGASELTVWRDQVAIPSGYAASSWTVLCLMPNGRAEPIEELEFLDELGAALAPSAATCRGDAIWFVCNRKVYRTILRDLRI